jgi:uncharacterized cupin superfamily protein
MPPILPASAGTFGVCVESLELDPDAPSPDAAPDAPRTANRVVWRSPDGRVLRGVWEITPGVVSDVEEDELFVVVRGRATVEVEGGEAFELAPGVLGVLERGQRTTWTVHETLRKAYQLTLAEPA